MAVLKRLYKTAVLLLLTAFCLPVPHGMAARSLAPAAEVPITGLSAEIDRLAGPGGVAVEKDGRLIFSRNQDSLYIPASIIKIATSLAVINILGPEYRFVTRFYLDADQTLYIQGTGDPLLTSEEAALIMTRLKERGIGQIRDMVIDDSAFKLDGPADGTDPTSNPYNAVNSALAVNFNTVCLYKEPDGLIRSAEDLTPTLPLMAGLARGLTPGRHRLNITAGKMDAQESTARYAGELFRAMQAAAGIPGEGTIRQGRVPQGLATFYEHYSSMGLTTAIEQLMHFSNNFIANQLFLACAVRQFGWPATWEKGRTALQQFLRRELGLTEKEVQIVEGSGLSRGNRISPQAMVKVLKSFRPYATLLKPMGEEDKGQAMLIKSGTLAGVYAYAGYFAADGRFDPFVIMLNESENKRDRLLALVARFYQHERAGVTMTEDLPARMLLP